MLAVDLLHYLPTISEAMLTANLLLCSSPSTDHRTTLRLVRVICSRCEERPEDRQIISKWLTNLLSQPAAGLRSAAGAKLVESAAMGLVKIAGNICSRACSSTLCFFSRALTSSDCQRKETDYHPS